MDPWLLVSAGVVTGLIAIVLSMRSARRRPV